MNNNILRKCLEELGKEQPKLDYIRGMLETLIEMQTIVVQQEPQGNLMTHPSIHEVAKQVVRESGAGNITVNGEPVLEGEAAILEAEARAAMPAVQALIDKMDQSA